MCIGKGTGLDESGRSLIVLAFGQQNLGLSVVWFANARLRIGIGASLGEHCRCGVIALLRQIHLCCQIIVLRQPFVSIATKTIQNALGCLGLIVSEQIVNLCVPVADNGVSPFLKLFCPFRAIQIIRRLQIAIPDCNHSILILLRQGILCFPDIVVRNSFFAV